MDRWRRAWAGGLWPRGAPTTWPSFRLESPLFHAMQAITRNLGGYGEYGNCTYLSVGAEFHLPFLFTPG